jgi:hypothetical protein
MMLVYIQGFQGKGVKRSDHLERSSQSRWDHERTKKYKESLKELLYYFINFEIVSDKIEPTKNPSKIPDFYQKNSPKIFIRNLGNFCVGVAAVNSNSCAVAISTAM